MKNARDYLHIFRGVAYNNDAFKLDILLWSKDLNRLVVLIGNRISQIE